MHLFIKLAFIVCPPLPDTGIRIAGSKQQESPLLTLPGDTDFKQEHEILEVKC